MDSSPISPVMATVLVVENDAGNRSAFQRILERAGFQVVTAEDGRVALAEVGQHPFHAILCDVNMPRLNGLGFYAVLQELFPDVASRVIFISAVPDDSKLQGLLQDTGRPVLAKPIEMAALVSAVRQVVERQG